MDSSPQPGDVDVVTACPRVTRARRRDADGADGLEAALELARACARGAVLGSWKGRRLDAEGREEVVQETLLRVLHGITRTDRAVESLQDWVRGTVELVLRERWHERRRAPLAAGLAPGAAAEPLSHEPHPEERLLAAERRHQVRACLDGLPPHYRRMLHLRYRERQTNAAIAARLGKSEKAVERAVPRALKLVRACLERKRAAP